MISDRYIELMNQEIDGVNSREDRIELQEFLETDAEGRTYFNELKSMAQSLDASEAVDPPPELRQYITSNLAVKECKKSLIRSQKESLAGFWQRWIVAFRRKQVPVFAAGLAVGMSLIALLVWSPRQTVPFDNDKLFGTMSIDRSSSNFLTKVPVVVDASPATGTATVHFFKDKILTNLDLTTAEEVQVIFSYDDDIRFEGLKTSDEQEYQIDVSRGSIRLGLAGASQFALFFKNPPRKHSSLGIQIYTDENLIFEQVVSSRRQ